MALIPPSPIQEVASVFNTTTAKTTPAFTVYIGDILVAIGIMEDTAPTFGTLTDNTSTSANWILQQEVTTSSIPRVVLYTKVVTVTESMTVSLSATGGSSPWFGVSVSTWRNSGGVGVTDKATGSGAPSLALVNGSDNSAIVVANGDWNAVDGASRVWRTINTIIPTAANGLEQVYFRDASHYGAYSAYWTDCGAAGSKTTGLSAPTGQAFGIVACEIKGLATVPSGWLPIPRGTLSRKVVIADSGFRPPMN